MRNAPSTAVPFISSTKVLATTQAGAPQRKAAEAAFKTSAPKARDIHNRIGTLENEAEQARTKLATDTAARAKNMKAIQAGERADTKLRMRLRSRLADALSSGDLLPLWFVTVSVRCRQAREPTPGWDTATDLLAYRATYQVSDPAVALGPKPGPGTSRRTTWYAHLTKALNRWNQ